MIACLTSELHKSNHSRKSKLIQQSLFFFTANRAMNSVQSRFCNRKMLRPPMPHPQDKHSFTFQRAFIPQHLKYATKRKGLCARKTFNSKRHQETWKKSKPRLSQESWT
ncbi:orf108b (mitochondrion) [Beta vulgaris subsp. vulgaris]|uniref:Orf108b protein n=3 Tax=Beta TaxID=3554 RepID=Q9MF44_BETVV|nr:orf108b [Beta vulgaris subsp. vulgaris]YP_004222340.1 hypothetical protein LKY74_mgp059 [Beta vulgaris subsp. maritima]YP_004842145.1 hypothetical protein LKY79_mgp060 [Beta macrocarpa]CBJ14070.1 hypothetical protein [Beta vulgaris subsp. maritima]CBJ17560.1 hypothetical protein [Beta vulgaris subsp. maritima]CBJ20720.1 hypothetical protein [Beta vulgaris subsp. maritima]CBL51968.1 hypothetical protein [Beta vulgaris subsp. maritima]CBX24950.1 hypothetical protein [Beta macrocarpa]